MSVLADENCDEVRKSTSRQSPLTAECDPDVVTTNGCEAEPTGSEVDCESIVGEDKHDDHGECEEALEDRNDDFICHICEESFKSPKVLTCLHVFCQDCIEKLVEPMTPEEGEKPINAIICPVCSQETRVGAKGASDLQPDNVMVNMQDMESIQKMKVICTSCKASEKAVARCSDCANFLCPNCVTAHKYMRCFENHKVKLSFRLQFRLYHYCL